MHRNKIGLEETMGKGRFKGYRVISTEGGHIVLRDKNDIYEIFDTHNDKIKVIAIPVDEPEKRPSDVTNPDQPEPSPPKA
jgi:hypothetical protein